MAIVNKLRTVLNLIETFIKQPQLSYKLLGEIPSFVRGFKYSQQWESCISDNASMAGSNLPGKAELPNSLKSYFHHHREGKGIWKWEHYFDIYHRYFNKFIGTHVHVLEIGVCSGGSLEMWRNYFGPNCHIYGIDIEEACKVYENEYTKIFIGDQADRNFWGIVKSKIPKIDILIDDGGHRPKQQIITLEEMLPFISPGGIYVCEDIHGARNRFTSFACGLVNSLNNIHAWAGGINCISFQKWIQAVHFYPYIMVIEKADRPQELISSKYGTEWPPFFEKIK